jgi:crossover junction endodeoxyribonuclease RuvC
MRYYLGVDPGTSGAFGVVNEHGAYVGHCLFTETLSDIYDQLEAGTYQGTPGKIEIDFALLEQVHSMPKQGVSSSFKFGMSFGFCLGLLTCSKIPYELISPVKWQNEMHCRTGGDKNITKQLAQQLWPNIKITHGFAEALLLAELARRKRMGLLL